MKPKITCQMDGGEMNFLETHTVATTSHLRPFYTIQKFQCSTCRYLCGIEADDEKSARRAWKAGLMGQLRQEWKRKWLPRENTMETTKLFALMDKLFGGGDGNES